MAQFYKKSFREATGLSLDLRSSDEAVECRRAGRELPASASGGVDSRGAHSATAINLKEAGLDVSPGNCDEVGGKEDLAVPIVFNSAVIGHLVVSEPADGDSGSVENQRLRGAVALAAYFSEQLSRLAGELELVERGAEPIGILRARKFIQENLTARLSLSKVARQAALSESHFCRVFKTHTGLTLTEYVTRRRIAQAKRELLRASLRITEVAFMVGFQSLSQFNRSFVRVEGCSPSRFRADRIQEYEKLSA